MADQVSTPRQEQARLRDMTVPPRTQYRKRKVKRGLPTPPPSTIMQPDVVIAPPAPVSPTRSPRRKQKQQQKQQLSKVGGRSLPPCRVIPEDKPVLKRKVRRVPRSQAKKYQTEDNEAAEAALVVVAPTVRAASGPPPGSSAVRNDLAAIMQKKQQQMASTGNVPSPRSTTTTTTTTTTIVVTPTQPQTRSVRKVRKVLRSSVADKNTKEQAPPATAATSSSMMQHQRHFPAAGDHIDKSLKLIIAQKAAVKFKKKEKRIQRAIRKLENEPEPAEGQGVGMCFCVIL